MNGVSEAIILHDNARPQSIPVSGFIGIEKLDLIISTPYSLDMNPCDFNCFGHLKEELKGNNTEPSMSRIMPLQ
jgi:hypothetical protein